jgi:hypothetical protein
LLNSNAALQIKDCARRRVAGNPLVIIKQFEGTAGQAVAEG